MDITEIRIRKMYFNSKLKATVSVIFDDEIVIHDMKIIEGQNGMFVAMPSRRMMSGEYKDIAHPVNSFARGKIQQAVMDKYYQTLQLRKEAASE